jgi:hypothetical protein
MPGKWMAVVEFIQLQPKNEVSHKDFYSQNNFVDAVCQLKLSFVSLLEIVEVKQIQPQM